MENAYNNFSLLRFLLATLVVFGHFKTLPGLSAPHGLFSYADFAVDAFFVVSGYLIYGSYHRLPHLRSFYIKRLLRIYPLYHCMIFLQAAAMLALLGGAPLYETLRYLDVNLIFANFLQYDIGGLLSGLHNPGINPSLWTLKIEVGFYIVLPVICEAMRRYGAARVLLTLYIASVAFYAATQFYHSENMSKQLPAQLRFFVAGMAFYHYQGRLRIHPAAALLAAIALFIICHLRHSPLMAAIYPLAVSGWVFLCAARIPLPSLKHDISYGVYLLHGPLIQLSLLLGYFSDTPAFLALLLAVVFTLALAAEALIERPGIRLAYTLARRTA